LLEVNLDDTVEVLNSKTNLKEILSFDYLAICTGCSYPYPIKDENAHSLGERAQSMQKMYQDIQESDSILIAGGGVVGVEIAGDLACKYGKSKKVGICLRGERLIPMLPAKMGEAAETFLTEQGIQLMHKTDFVEGVTA
jgi:NADH dehydrogenase FAD-containing subunit